MTPAPITPRPARLAAFVRWIYWSTPLFALLDFGYGVNLRLPFSDAVPGAKAVYYIVDVGCALALVLRPRWTAAIGLAESGVNIGVLALSTMVAYLGVLDSAASPDAVIVNPFTPEAVASLVISATVLAASYLSSASAGAAHRSRYAPGGAS